MKASVGDRIVTASGVVGAAVREGVVVSVRNADGSPPYLVRWSDTGDETLVFPGPDTVVRHGDGGAQEGEAAGAATGTSAGHGVPARSTTWHVQLTLVESQGSTTAEATLVAGPAEHGDVGALRAVGHARKDPGDEEVPVIGDEVAAGRALRRLADALLGQAEQDISARTGNKAHVHP
ncbi:dsRBD fold-containing protein [Isoptericola variabilis]|uniref:DUF1918 domain-containing protein n=1 Tax=Isoptericola variabilis (strain 225) TaxID=743718 RepID=F6FXC4_ISOV2|nr:dsRBD fold-containing protein [Isoptericola variabilis]AEG43627.1 Domain of unknown function DUF1918 [Isoptericola variabilis 225]TWH32003.1 uncharacterized protein DUF1918 [Isoptericola variabilis J7]